MFAFEQVTNPCRLAEVIDTGWQPLQRDPEGLSVENLGGVSIVESVADRRTDVRCPEPASTLGAVQLESRDVSPESLLTDAVMGLQLAFTLMLEAQPVRADALPEVQTENLGLEVLLGFTF